MNKLFLLLVLIPIILSKTTPSWTLNVKNENMDDKQIVLIPGIYTKVTFVLSREDTQDLTKEEDEVNFKLSLNDDNLVSYDNEYTITPTNSLEFTAYVGLKCGHSIKTSTYDLSFNLKATVDKDGDDISRDAKLTINTAKVKISAEKAKIEIEPFIDTIREQSYCCRRVNSKGDK